MQSVLGVLFTVLRRGKIHFVCTVAHACHDKACIQRAISIIFVKIFKVKSAEMSQKSFCYLMAEAGARPAYI